MAIYNSNISHLLVQTFFIVWYGKFNYFCENLSKWLKLCANFKILLFWKCHMSSLKYLVWILNTCNVIYIYHHNYLSAKFQVKIHNFRGWLKLSACHITLPTAKKAPSHRNFSKILSIAPGGMLVLASL